MIQSDELKPILPSGPQREDPSTTTGQNAAPDVEVGPSVPRATWAHLESGVVRTRRSRCCMRRPFALGVSLEELLAAPRGSARVYRREQIRVQRRGQVSVQKLLPDPLPGVEIDRLELPRGARFAGVPHTAGTREYLTCERGAMRLVASGDQYDLRSGDVVTFRGDQKHSYHNTGDRVAVGYSVVLLVSPLVAT